MDLMAIRRGLMAIMASGAYKTKSVTVESAVSNATGMVTWLNSVIPSGATKLFVLKDDISDVSSLPENTLITITYVNNGIISYVRYKNNNYNALGNTALGSTYDVILTQGDKYTIIFQ